MAAKPLTKSQIATAIAEKANIPKRQAVEVLETIAELAYKNAKNSFTLPGLGKLVLVNRKARMQLSRLPYWRGNLARLGLRT